MAATILKNNSRAEALSWSIEDYNLSAYDKCYLHN